MSKTIKKIFSAYDLEKLIQNRFCEPAWAFLPQVRNGTGYLRTTRTADAIAMSLYPSRGLNLYGFEIKVYRSDWLSELKNPAKAEAIARFCDYWYIVAPKDMIKIEELPSTWGLMIPYGATLKIVKQAEKLKAKKPDKLFLAYILRKTQECITPDAKLVEECKQSYKKGIEEGKSGSKCVKEDLIRLQKNVKQFEEISGVRIDTWQGGEIGEAVKKVLNGEHLRVEQNLKNLLERGKNIVEYIEKSLNGEGNENS